jgi:hypothetical protein
MRRMQREDTILQLQEKENVDVTTMTHTKFVTFNNQQTFILFIVNEMQLDSFFECTQFDQDVGFMSRY